MTRDRGADGIWTSSSIRRSSRRVFHGCAAKLRDDPDGRRALGAQELGFTLLMDSLIMELVRHMPVMPLAALIGICDKCNIMETQ